VAFKMVIFDHGVPMSNAPKDAHSTQIGDS